MSGWFDLTQEGIVEVGIDAELIGEANNVDAVSVEIDAEHYTEEQLARCAGVLALVEV